MSAIRSISSPSNGFYNLFILIHLNVALVYCIIGIIVSLWYIYNQSSSGSPWTEGSDVRISYGSTVYINMSGALSLFENWLPTKLSQLGFTFDQATVFTG